MIDNEILKQEVEEIKALNKDLSYLLRKANECIKESSAKLVKESGDAEYWYNEKNRLAEENTQLKEENNNLLKAVSDLTKINKTLALYIENQHTELTNVTDRLNHVMVEGPEGFFKGYN